MDYEFLINGKISRLILSNNKPDGVYEAILDGKSVKMRVSHIESNSLSLTINNRISAAYVVGGDGKVFVHLGGRTIELAIPDSNQKKYSKEGMEFGAKDEITTPMPGKIVRMLVKVGDTVEPKQPLVIVESMKMENEIKSSMQGTIQAINFKSGDLVNPGQTIIKMSPLS